MCTYASKVVNIWIGGPPIHRQNFATLGFLFERWSSHDLKKEVGFKEVPVVSTEWDLGCGSMCECAIHGCRLGSCGAGQTKWQEFQHGWHLQCLFCSCRRSSNFHLQPFRRVPWHGEKFQVPVCFSRCLPNIQSRQSDAKYRCSQVWCVEFLWTHW